MSHVQDSTSLSDLLHTSPLASSTNVQADTKGPSLNLAASNTLQITDAEQPEDATVELIKLQGSKIELIEQRDNLVKQRSEINSKVEDARLRLRFLKERQTRNAARKRMDELLKENTHEYHRAINTRNREQEDYVSKSLNVYPSTDWDKRLDQLRMFTPHLELEKLDTANYYNDDNRMMRTIQYTVVSPLLFKIPLRVDVDYADDSVVNIQFGKLDTPPMLIITSLSPSLAKALLQNYIPNKKINLVMYSLNSLSILVHRRISTMYKIIRKYRSLINDQSILRDLLAEQECDDNLTLFAIMKSLDRIQLEINNKHKVTLTWSIILKDTITGNCNSQLNLYVTDVHNKHHENYHSLNEAFQNLVKQYGVQKALENLLKNAFGYTV
ncbi:uncharacterized protein SPAPADRAFT_60537 [Spathaspora passalidarum NRRL Y-27907]|uniref:Uncharacterized protein n=1 Tax=Spathaspora passalidarum (strain NRRL Y-27907 / 11-Y1) TaxID=619300 RepID=G3ALG5_SPAPN|nr:uncharacterized protein SPAPADRAFT_60537 [Spathaspora passalidarum NRRL Y-27907]EGW33208.1 hypothetical protein SPAPADRAFT_60537 [Spathaspora passalidarum NRRL Y-27907]